MTNISKDSIKNALGVFSAIADDPRFSDLLDDDQLAVPADRSDASDRRRFEMLGNADLAPLRALLGLSSDFEERLTRAVADRIAEGCEPPLSRLLTINQVAEVLAVSESTIRRLMKDEKIVYIRVGESNRFRPDDVDAYIERQAVE